MVATRYPGFTLIELLVVIAVIAFLIGMLLPAIAMALGAAHRFVSVSNKRISNAFDAIARGFQGRLSWPLAFATAGVASNEGWVHPRRLFPATRVW